MPQPPPSQQIVGEQLSAVVFVMDYVQLQFNSPPTLTVLTPITVIPPGSSPAVRSGDDQFRNRLCEQITKIVSNVTVTSEEFRIVFEDQTVVSISLRAEDCPWPESVVIHGRENSLQVFRPSEVGQ